ncbi:MAG: hypothetical protein AAF495_14710 [Pseudomonadota bacterium]
MSRARANGLVVLLWLGLAASLVLFQAVPQNVVAPPRPTPEPPAPTTQKAEAPVQLPAPPRLEAAAAAPAPPPDAPAPPAPKVVKPLKPAPAPTKPLPAPKAKVVEALKPTPTPAPKPEPKPEAAPAPKVVQALAPAPAPSPVETAAPPMPETITVAEPEAKEGRTLLRLLEHGSGPEIELAWPETSAGRARLFRHLRACQGMELAVMDAAGELLRNGAPWRPNLDRYSGFLRRPSGQLQPEERRLVQFGGQAVRLFPRQVDALLLGGLHALIGADYGRLAVIHGRYRLDGGKVLIDQVTGDGRSFPGRIDLSPAARGCGHGLT